MDRDNYITDDHALETIEHYETEWRAVITAVSIDTRQIVAQVIQTHTSELTTQFYKTMLSNPSAANFLNHSIVEMHLNAAMQHWLTSLFATEAPISTALAQQIQVGNSHAHIKIPIHLVGRGARYLKRWICELIAADTHLNRDELQRAVIYVNDLIDLAFELMNASFISNTDHTARTDEAYRLFSLSQDLAIERERQRAALIDWNHKLMHFAYRQPCMQAPLIGQSEFGLWLIHKALFMFDRAPEVRQIQAIAQHIDTQIVQQFSSSAVQQFSSSAVQQFSIITFFSQIDKSVSEIKFLLTSLFDRYLEVENGRDTLTKLLNRRFLPSAMTCEMNLANKTQHPFGVMLIDIDHFKRVNDTYGHDAGDIVLQQIAGLILNTVRSGDFVFRYGGEEILVILVNINATAALSVAENMRRKIEQAHISLSGGKSLQITASIGLAVYDGHPDYRRLITQADAAVYQAKRLGRNQCVLADYD